MAQFIAYQNKNKTTKKTYPYLLDIQSNLLDEVRTTVVIPLTPMATGSNIALSKLCPIFDLEGKKYIAMTQLLAGVDRKSLGKEIYDLSEYRQEIIAAMDFIISGI